MDSAFSTHVNADYPIGSAYELATKMALPSAGDCPYTLFLGAGASASSGVRDAGSLIHEWRQALYRMTTGSTQKPIELDAYAIWLQTDYLAWLRTEGRRGGEYGALFRYFYVTTTERQVFIERELDGRIPASGYQHLAGLIAASRVSQVLTTNFDDLLSDALVRSYDIKPVVCAFDSSIRSIRLASRRPRIIKLHGDFLYDDIRHVEHAARLVANMEEKLAQGCRDGGLIVVGYDGNDESIMQPLEVLVRSNDYLKMGLHWCLHRPNPSTEPLAIPPILRRALEKYPERIKLYPIDGFDEFMREVFVACGCERRPTGGEERASMLQSTFLSYGAPDTDFAARLNDALRKHGVTTFFFAKDAPPGRKLHHLMRDGVNKHDRVILICSKASLDRTGVLNEIGEALAREARDGNKEYLIPITLDDYVFKDWAPEEPGIAQAIRDRVVADFRDAELDARNFDDCVARLIAALKK